MKKQVKTNYKIGGIVLLIAMLAIIFPTASSANLQSRPGAKALVNTSSSDFFLLCREMETSTGPLGLNATIEEGDKVTESTPSNGIDVHMIKNTEYGTAEMLGASAYGDLSESERNDSGIKHTSNGSYEYVAGINYNPNSSYKDYYKYIWNADEKYKNVYKNTFSTDDLSNVYIPGDATYETLGWISGKYEFVWQSDCVVLRGSLFRQGTYQGYCGKGTSWYKSRAAVVCGEGF